MSDLLILKLAAEIPTCRSGDDIRDLDQQGSCHTFQAYTMNLFQPVCLFLVWTRSVLWARGVIFSMCLLQRKDLHTILSCLHLSYVAQAC